MFLAAGFSAYSFDRCFFLVFFVRGLTCYFGFIVAGFGVGVLCNAGLDGSWFGVVGGGLGVCWVWRICGIWALLLNLAVGV